MRDGSVEKHWCRSDGTVRIIDLSDEKKYKKPVLSARRGLLLYSLRGTTQTLTKSHSWK